MTKSSFSCREIRNLVCHGAQLVDVRSPQEFAAGSLPEAINLPLQTLSWTTSVFNRTQPFLVYCGDGRNSGMALVSLKHMGFDHVYDLGSLRDYQDC